MIERKQESKKKEEKRNIGQNFLKFRNQLAKTILRGVKMAGVGIYDPHISNKDLYNHLHDLGPSVLALKPETLMAEMDKKYGGVDSEKISAALIHFHETGELQTDIPEINRQRLYALRILITSDTAYHEWHVFEKIGSVMNGRLAHFGVVEPLSPLECAVAVSVMDAVRPDTFSEEIASYVAACCHQEGIYTLKPCRWLSFADSKLQMMNKEQSGREVSPEIVSNIESKLYIISKGDYKPEEEFSDIQAMRILAMNKAGDSFTEN